MEAKSEPVVKAKRQYKKKADNDKPKRSLPESMQKRTQFFKDNYDKVRSLPNNERFKRLSELYKESQK